MIMEDERVRVNFLSYQELFSACLDNPHVVGIDFSLTFKTPLQHLLLERRELHLQALHIDEDYTPETKLHILQHSKIPLRYCWDGMWSVYEKFKSAGTELDLYDEPPVDLLPIMFSQFCIFSQKRTRNVNSNKNSWNGW